MRDFQGLKEKGLRNMLVKKQSFSLLLYLWAGMYFRVYTMSFLGPYLPSNIEQYLFPLNMLANSFNANSLVWLVFIFMAAAWPFIGAAYLAKFIKSHKNVSCTDKTINRCNIQETAGKLEGWGWNI